MHCWLFFRYCCPCNSLAIASDLDDLSPKRVLIIYSYHEGMPWERLIDDSLRATLASKSTEPIELNVEHSERIRYPDDAYLQNLVRKTLRGGTNQLEIKYLAEITRNDLLQKVARLPENSVILYMQLSRDSEGKYFVPREILSDISRKANAPTKF